jgi:8-oxo-dGTP diphosphatase
VHRYDTFSIQLIGYRCTFISATFALTDHDAYEWVVPEQLTDFNLAAADIPFVEQVKLFT